MVKVRWLFLFDVYEISEIPLFFFCVSVCHFHSNYRWINLVGYETCTVKRLHLDSNQNTKEPGYSEISNLPPYQLRLIQVKSGQERTWTSRSRSYLIYSQDRYQLRGYLPKSAAHRIRTCKPLRANGFQDRSFTTQTCSIIWKCGCWDSNPNHQIHNLRYWPVPWFRRRNHARMLRIRVHATHGYLSLRSRPRDPPSLRSGNPVAVVRQSQWSQRDSNPAFPAWKAGELAIYSMGPRRAYARWRAFRQAPICAGTSCQSTIGVFLKERANNGYGTWTRIFRLRTGDPAIRRNRHVGVNLIPGLPEWYHWPCSRTDLPR